MLEQRFLIALPRLDQLTPMQAAVAGAVRRWAAALTRRECPLRAAHDRLGCGQAARQLHLLLDLVGACWPEPFAVAPPCGPTLTHDEATLLVMIEAAPRRPVFDALLCEMLDQDARDRLHGAALALARAVG